MSRTNPYKKKKRRARKTLLMFGEGFNEEIFLKHLRKLYSYNSGTATKVKSGKGGDAQSIIIDADKTYGAFDRKIVVLDNDKPKNEMVKARQEAKRRKIELIENTPCLEFLLMSIIIGKKLNEKNSSWYKSEFESKYLDRKKRREPNEYDKLFPKKLLDSKRPAILELNKLISIMEGK
ncbi:MAG: RloB domain-containing protein [Patescibacteria group bacterium]|nr:RloB domain-containing protein [Patescibacteria group bacterium]